MAKRKIRINSSRAHRALRDLLGQLNKADLSDLKARAKPKSRKIRELDQWLEALETAALAIPDWCPTKRVDNQFTFDAEPKSRRR